MAKQKYIGAVLTLKDNMSATLKGVRKEQSAFRKDVENTRKSLEKGFNKKYNMKLNNTAAMKAIQSTRKALDPLRKKIVVATAYKDMITSKLQKTHNKLKVFAKQVFSPVVAIKDKTTSFFSKIKNSIFNMKTLIATALASIGVGKILGAGSDLEKNQISMEHFIGIQNAGMSQADIKKTSKNYVAQLRKNAQETPFDDPEVLAAGTRALNIAKGDTGSAMSLVQLSENMAALNPEKSLSDAMEAVADLKVGETERMKEFGFKISQADIKNAGGVDAIINKQIQPFFEGGAKKLSKSASGLWSTMTGMAAGKLQDLGLSILEKSMPYMEKVISWLEKSGPTIDVWAGRISSGIGFVMEKGTALVGKVQEYMPAIRQTIGNVVDWITSKFGWLSTKTGFLKEAFSTAWSGIKSVMQVAWKILKPIFNLTANAVRLLFEAFQFAFPGIKKVVSGVWKIVKPMLEGLGDIIGLVAKGVGKLADWIGEKNKKKQKKKSVNGSHANGLTRVPFDGYIAELHRNEAVIPANQNPYIQNQTANTVKEERKIEININGVNKSTNEIINEMVPQLKLALSNM